MSRMTTKQRLYADARMTGLTQKESAIQAGCPEKTAEQAGSRYDKHKNVLAYWQRMGFCIETKERTPNKPAVAKRADRIMKSKDYGELGLSFLAEIVENDLEDPKLRQDSAKFLAKYALDKANSKTVKEQKEDGAKKAENRFSVSPAPLRSVK